MKIIIVLSLVVIVAGIAWYWRVQSQNEKMQPDIQISIYLEKEHFFLYKYNLPSDSHMIEVEENYKKKDRGEGKLNYEVGLKTEIEKYIENDKKVMIQLWGEDGLVRENHNKLSAFKNMANVKITTPMQTSVNVKLIKNEKIH